MAGFTYIVTNENNTTFYIGVSSNIYRRIDQHKRKAFAKSFTARYNVSKLVYFEFFENIVDAISREKEMKKFSRTKKILLVKANNPEFQDLFPELEKEFLE